MKRFDPARLIQALREDKVYAVPEGWLRTRDIVPLLGLKTMSGARLPLERMIRAGFVEYRWRSPGADAAAAVDAGAGSAGGR